ncbi:MAG: HNH endonuclease domain-containing protein [Saprospiraceae bacterium]
MDIQSLSRVFQKTSTSYKFYWFYSLLKAIKANKKEVLLTDLYIQMVVNVWYPNHYFKINFGIQDRLGKLANEALGIKELNLKIDTKTGVLTQELSKFITKHPKHSFSKSLLKLQDYVPFRFISPWLKPVTKGLKDGKLNREINRLATVGTNHKLPYYFDNDKLIFDEDWFNYLQKHLKIMEDFCFWNLLNYLQKRNPNVPNIAAKLFPPTNADRSLSKQHKFWKTIIEHQNQPIRCVYSNEIINEKYSLDHFIPWSFVTHNQLWNLTPITQSVNSQKSNNLPKLDLYFEPFSNLQYAVFQTAFQLNLNKRLEDYLDVFNADLHQIQQLSKSDFKTKLRQQIEPLSQIAANMGFTKDWIYQE